MDVGVPALGPLRPPQVRDWAYATAGVRCLSVSMCGSVLAALPSFLGICSALVCPRPPQAPMIESSSLSRACSPILGGRGECGGGGTITTKSLGVPPSPPPSTRFRKAPRNPRCEAGTRPTIGMKLRNADASAAEGDTSRGPWRGFFSRDIITGDRRP